jgi:hypothetical protein
MNTGLMPVWAGCNMRLDPYRLPQVVTYALSDEFGDVLFTIDRRGATIKRTLKNAKLPVTIAIPACAFKGVAARAIEEETGEVTVTLELLHADDSLSVPLLVASDLDDIAADWRAWSEAYDLPMMLVEADGVARVLEDTIGEHRPSVPPRRRKGSTLARRRPRFLARRKCGELGLRLVIEGEEIIARS